MTRFDQMVDARLLEIRDVVRSGVTERVGKVKRDPVTGDAIGRMGGGLTEAYPEISSVGLTPGRAADAIERGKGKPFVRLRKAAEREIEKFHERPRRRAPEKPTVPAHAALSKKCKVCKVDHGKSAHRFHGEGAYHRTHLFSFKGNPVMTRERAKVIFVTHMQAAQKRKLTRYELDQLSRARQALRRSRRSVMNPGTSGRYMVVIVWTDEHAKPYAALWKARGSVGDISKARQYAKDNGGRVFIYPTGKKLAEAKRDAIRDFVSSYPRKNPPVTKIYGRVLRVEAQKTGKHWCDAECRRCGHRYYHDFRRKPSMYGLPDGSILIKDGR